MAWFSMSTTLTLDGSGNLLLPAAVTQLAHLPSGAKVDVDVVGDRIVLQAASCPQTAKVHVARKGKRFVVRGVPKPFDAVAAIKADREERDAKLARIVSGK